MTDLNSRVNARVVPNVDGWTHRHMHEQTKNWLSAHPLMMLYICTKFCESISKGLRVTSLNSRVSTRVVANVDAGWTDIWAQA